MEFEKSRLEKLKRTLYSRNEKLLPQEKRTPVSGREYSAPKDWGDKPSFAMSSDSMVKRNSFFNKFLLWSVIFFFVAIGIASLIFFGGFNSISSNNIDIKISGPSDVSSGQELDLGVSVVNGNQTTLEQVELFVEYPDGTESVVNSNAPLTQDKLDIGTLGSGQSKNNTIRALLFGQKDEVKTLTFRVEYNVAGSNAVFSKEKTYDVSISSSPILLNVTYPPQVTSGAPLTLSVTVTSNSSVPVSNVLAKVEYPYGFTYQSSSIAPIPNSNVWNLGDLKDGDTKTFSITGTLVGQDMEDRSFRFSVGTGDTATAKTFSTDLAVQQPSVSIEKSFYNLSVTSSANTLSNINVIGQSVPVSISWQNTLPDKIINNTVTATLSGNAFDPSQVSVTNNGFYNSSNNTISWSKNTTSSLSEIDPGDSGNVSFSVTSLSNPFALRSITNPHIDVAVQMSGSRPDSGNASVSSTENITLKFASTLSLSAKSYRLTGPFSNTGPIPPRENTESTYTVIFLLTNTTNDLSGTTVSAVLPQNVVWKGQTSPNTERISYDPDSRTVTWSVDSILAGTGFTYSPRQVSFQVGLTPNVNQVGEPLDLVDSITASSTDTYANGTISAGAQNVTTHFSDSGFVSGNDIVAK